MPIPRMNPWDFAVLAPEIVLAAWGLLVLTVDFALLRKRETTTRRNLLGALTLVGGVLAMLATPILQRLGIHPLAPQR